MNLISIPASQDSYAWALNENNGRYIIVDSSEAAPVLAAIEEDQWQPETILLAHHHQDHVSDIEQLHEEFPSIVVYGPTETQDKGVAQMVGDDDRLSILGYNFSVFSTPDHTLGYIYYHSEPYLFYGDTTFSDGCGKLFEGTAGQIYQSFMRINALPGETLICCVHEYTLANMKFALSILLDDRDINDYYHKVNELCTEKQKTLPVALKSERRINLFSRVNDIDLIDKINQETDLQRSVARFAWLGSKEDDS